MESELPHPALRGAETTPPADEPIRPNASDPNESDASTATLEREPAFESPHTHTPSLRESPLQDVFTTETDARQAHPLLPLLVMFQQSDAWARHGSCIGRNLAVAWVFIPMVIAYFAMTFGVALSAGTGVPGPAIAIMLVTGLVGSALGTLLAYAINGTWFKIRLLFCGVPWCEAEQARRIWAVAYVPTLLPMLIVPFAPFEDPMALLTGPFLMIYAIAFPLSMGWATISGFTGVRTTFPDAGRASSAVWFLILPMMLAAGSLAGAVTFPGMIDKALAADVVNTRAYEEGDIRFEHAGNWIVLAENPDASIRIQPILQEAYYNIEVYDSMNSPDDELQVTIDQMMSQAAAGVISDSDREQVQRGAYTGVQRSVVIQSSDGPRHITTFVSDLGRDRMLEIQFSYPEKQAAMIEPGFQLIERTLFIIR